MVQVLNNALAKVPSRRGVGLASSAGAPAKSVATKNFSTTSRKSKPAKKSILGIIATDQPVIGDSTASKPLTVPTHTGSTSSATKSWHIQIGAFANEAQARARLVKIQKAGYASLKGKQIVTLKYSKGYRARFAGFNKSSARKACGVLKKRSIACFAVAPRG